MEKDEIYRSQFRLPYSLYEKLKDSSEANNRSVNAELIARLEESYIKNSDTEISILKEQNKHLMQNLHEIMKSNNELKHFLKEVHDVLSNPKD